MLLSNFGSHTGVGTITTHLSHQRRSSRMQKSTLQLKTARKKKYQTPFWLLPFRPTSRVSSTRKRIGILIWGSEFAESMVDIFLWVAFHFTANSISDFLAKVAAVYLATLWSDFSTRLENNPHNTIHNQVGGTMGTWWSCECLLCCYRRLCSEKRHSAFDPIFWLHHCQVDRVLHKWFNMRNQWTTETSRISRANFHRLADHRYSWSKPIFAYSNRLLGLSWAQADQRLQLQIPLSHSHNSCQHPSNQSPRFSTLLQGQ